MQKDPNPINNQESLESLKEKFSNKLRDILYRKLTVENIETFADESLDNVIDLTSNIYEYYKNSGKLEFHSELEIRDQEDDAYNQLGLPKISEILSRIEEKKNEIDKIKDKIKKEYIDTVITPPQKNENGIFPGDGKSFEKKKLLPRLLTLMYILENDLEIELESVKITEGHVHDNMIRKTPYIRVEIDNLKRVVYICDEEGNASYVFDTEKLREKKITTKELDIDDKVDKNSLIYHYPGIGVRIIQTKNWRERVRASLEDEIIAEGDDKNPLGEVEEFENEKVESEFGNRTKRIILPYEEWIKELKSAYDSNTEEIFDFYKWYRKHAKQNPNWPINAISDIAKRYNVDVNQIYRSIGYERKLIREDKLPYDLFIEELREAFNACDLNTMGSFDSWYLEEAKKHKGWYRSNGASLAKTFNVRTEDIYKAIGYTKKVQKERIYTPFDIFIEELKKVYKESENIGDFSKWYKKECKKHQGWYKSSIRNAAESYGVTLDHIYDTIGYERKLQTKEILPYDKFITELKHEFESNKPNIKNFRKWYEAESKKHRGWYDGRIDHLQDRYNVPISEIYKYIGYIPGKKKS